MKVDPPSPVAGASFLLRDVLAGAVERLAAAGCETPRLDAELLLAHTLGQDRSWLYLYPRRPLLNQEADRFQELLERRERREPVAYITGRKEFFGLEFLVNQTVLIPRPETELLVETALDLARGRSPLTIADVGAGSGCIAITLALKLAAGFFYALDISAPALAVARQNAARHGIDGRVIFLQGDLLQPLAGPLDLIVSNPPYVSRADLNGGALPPEVAGYEPRLALDGGQAGLELVRRLLAQAETRLSPGGSLLVEIGSDQGPAVSALAAAHFRHAAIEVKKDLAGLDRLLVVRTAA